MNDFKKYQMSKVCRPLNFKHQNLRHVQCTVIWYYLKSNHKICDQSIKIIKTMIYSSFDRLKLVNLVVKQYSIVYRLCEKKISVQGSNEGEWTVLLKSNSQQVSLLYFSSIYSFNFFIYWFFLTDMRIIKV